MSYHRHSYLSGYVSRVLNILTASSQRVDSPPSHKQGVLRMTIKCIQWWDSSSETLGNIKSPLNYSQVVEPVRVRTMGQRFVWKLFLLEGNTWNHEIMCKLFALRSVTWINNCLNYYHELLKTTLLCTNY